MGEGVGQGVGVRPGEGGFCVFSVCFLCWQRGVRAFFSSSVFRCFVGADVRREATAPWLRGGGAPGVRQCRLVLLGYPRHAAGLDVVQAL